jgi:hypothetical protein
MNAVLLAMVLPIVEMVLSTFGSSVNDWLSAKRAEQVNRDLGRVSAERDQEVLAREAAMRELEASQNAPRNVEDAIARLEEGSA